MPVAPQTPKLAQSFRPLFEGNGPASTEDAARTWAKAYTDYAVTGGVTAARAKEPQLAAALAQAFSPELAGGGPPLFIQALFSFWIALPVPEQTAIVVTLIPSGSVESPLPHTATPSEQASSLAQVIAAFTLGSVRVQLTGPPFTILPLA